MNVQSTFDQDVRIRDVHARFCLPHYDRMALLVILFIFLETYFFEGMCIKHLLLSRYLIIIEEVFVYHY